MHITSEYVLELTNVFHSGQVEAGSFFEKVTGNLQTAVILKDVSVEVHGGEVMAILGSKGSGKRVLLDVISRRAQGPTRGQICLNGVPMSMRLFQESCGYVTSKCDLLEGLTVAQTLNYATNLTVGPKVSHFIKKSRVKQVMADLALLHVANRPVGQLTASEYKRLAIGVQLVRDPVVILLDDPTADLDPLHTYLVVSILSNHARKYNRIIILTMEKPRSDIFPFLDRVTYLCLGDIVYSGSTRLMLDYFRSIGFPCPEMENPLMYYLCLSTVDRRSRERFIESSNQIAALVDRFRAEGAPFRRLVSVGLDSEPVDVQHRVPLTAYGSPGVLRTLFTLTGRQYRTTVNANRHSFKHFAARLLLLPAYFFLLWIFYYGQTDYQHSFITRSGMIFNTLAGVSFLSIVATVWTYPTFRTRYYQESREGHYSGPVFLISHLLYSVPLSLIAVFGSAAILFWGLRLSEAGLNSRQLLKHQEDALAQDLLDWAKYSLILWSVYMFIEQQTIVLLMVVKDSYTAAMVSVYMTVMYLLLGTSVMRAITGLPDWLYYVSFIVQSRYASAYFHEWQFRGKFESLQSSTSSFRLRNCTGTNTNPILGCRYMNGTHFLIERYHLKHQPYADDLNLDVNFGVSLAFTGVIAVVNLILHIVPLPSFVKSKFRD